MTFSRMGNRQIKTISEEEYKDLLKDRDSNIVKFYSLNKFNKIPDIEKRNINFLTHRWSRRDNLYKLATYYYGNKKLWWVIAYSNQKPTNSHFTIGDLVLVPKPVEIILNYIT